MIEKMKFLSITGPKDDIDRVVDQYLSKYEIQLENALTELRSASKLEPYPGTNPYREPLQKAQKLLASCPGAKQQEISTGTMPVENAITLVNDMDTELAASDEERESLKAKEKEVSERYVKELATKTPSGDQLVVNLSGGNQQKVVIAKWLTRDSDILIFDEPTRGIDVGAKNEIYKLMSKLAAEGKSIIMISSEMTEILRLSDRIIVMCEGKVTGNIDISEATQEHIMDKATRNID